ncbi:MAG: glycerol-3-phosphate 1-O-acyltransferase PlsY [Clostridia bacterium]|nr:glycerol-3-phosphate 1-O-acyltransferase PlsY [Clostridia bacterium]
MTDVLLYILSLVIGYLIGSINVSVIVSNVVYNSDIRKHGSGNAGATNMSRVYGLFGGIVVLVCDFGKCIGAMCLAMAIGGDSLGELCSLCAGAGCMIGHAFPLYFKFKGGKCVTVGLALACMIDWRAALIIASVFLIVFLITQIVSLGSIIASMSFIIVLFGFYAFQGSTIYVSIYELILGVLAAIMVVVLHHSNIKRILDGTEKKFTYKKTKK